MARISPPESDEIELTVLGPNKAYGECILLHSGNNYWTAIDCCRNEVTKEPVPKEYLESLYGKDACQNIKHIVVSHWHDDHINGISDLYKASIESSLCMSSILRNKQSAEIIVADNMRNESSLSELYKVDELLHERRRQRNGNGKLQILGRDTMLHRSPKDEILAVALSPSSDAVYSHNLNLSKMVAEALGIDIDSTRKIPAVSPNLASIAILAKIQDDYILLGADLEFKKNHKFPIGWEDALESEYLVDVCPQVYKVSHHGSDTSYRIEMWQRLFTVKPFYALLAPYANADTLLPEKDMVKAILSHTNDAYITSNPYNKPNVSVAMPSKAFELPNECGIIQLRKKIGSRQKWKIRCFGSAMKLKEIL